MMFLIRFWSNLTKKDSVESAKYEIQFFSTFTPVLGRFFHRSGFFRIGSGFLADPYSEKKSDPDKKNGSETLDNGHINAAMDILMQLTASRCPNSKSVAPQGQTDQDHCSIGQDLYARIWFSCKLTAVLTCRLLTEVSARTWGKTVSARLMSF